MPIISVMPPELASQIAAGEVVERPASVAKELIENALDSGAERIEVHVVAGGMKELSVHDDGAGMEEIDARLAFERHATSKLARFADLETLRSYGFRGEALPSIASVSRVSLTTRTATQDRGVHLEVLGGHIGQTETLGAPPGTKVRVQDLFFNVPARLKFLRSTGTESSHVTDVFLDAALARPDVTFVLLREGREVRHLPRVGTRIERVEQIHEGDALGDTSKQRGPLLVEAYLSNPFLGRTSTTSFRILVNGRPIRDRAVSRTVASAFGPLLEKGRYPKGALYLDLPPSLVDINVHPQKQEVRFVDPRAIQDAVHTTISQMCSNFEKARPLTVRETLGSEQPIRVEAPRSGRSLSARASGASAAKAPLRRLPYVPPSTRVATEKALSSSTGAPTTPQSLTPQRSNESPSHSDKADASEPLDGRLRYLTQLTRKYLICERSDGLWILDQHALSERALEQELLDGYRHHTLRSQSLLFPLTFPLDPRAVQVLIEQSDALGRLGVDVRERGPQSVSLHSLPERLGRLSADEILAILTEELTADGPTPPTNPNEPSAALCRAIRRLSCRGSLQPGAVVGAQEAQVLLGTLDERQVGSASAPRSACGRGTPTLLRVGFDELERKSKPRK